MNTDFKGRAYFTQHEDPEKTSPHLHFYGKSKKTLSEFLYLVRSPETVKSLDLSNCNIIELPPLPDLKNLETLTLNNNLLNDFPDVREFKNLETINLNSNRISRIPTWIEGLSKLKILHLSGNHLNELPSQIGRLRSLHTLSLRGNKLTSLPKEIGKLVNLTKLVLSGNSLKDLPKEVGKLTKLRNLDLEKNFIAQLPKELGQLKELIVIDLVGNNLPFPDEIISDKTNPQKVLSFLVDYYTAKEEGKLRPLNEAKLVIVGEANVGKTCLINRLIYNKFVGTDSTHGIEIHRWRELKLENGERVQMNVWDFGGQEIMHSTHQFFFTKRTIYLLVVNARENQENNKTEEWLQRIKNLSQDSPIFILGNKIDENNRGTDKTTLGYFDIDRKNLVEKFPDLIKGIFGISSDVHQKQYDGLFEDFRKALTSEIGNLKEIHEKFPENWFEIKSQLEEMQANKVPYITFQDYVSRCLKAHIENEQSQRTLIDFMHDLGIALSFQDDDELRDLAVLNPEWVTRGVYALIDNSQITLEKGILRREQISAYLNESDYPPDKQDFIIKMMRKFKLLVDVVKNEVFLIPDLLPKDETDTGNWDNTLHFQYNYEIYEKSIIRRFLVSMYELRSGNTYWRYGIVLKRGENRALIKADPFKKIISIKIDGLPNTRREFLAIIRIEFDRIHATFDSIPFTEYIAHPTLKIPDEKDPLRPVSILEDFRKLLHMEEDGESEVYVHPVRKRLRLKEFLDGVESLEDRRKRRKPREKKSIDKGENAILLSTSLEVLEEKKKICDSESEEEGTRLVRILSVSTMLIHAISFAILILLIFSYQDGWNSFEKWTFGVFVGLEILNLLSSTIYFWTTSKDFHGQIFVILSLIVSD